MLRLLQWLLARETWEVHAYTPRRLSRLVSELQKRGMTKKQVQAAFRREFLSDVEFVGGTARPVSGQETIFRSEFRKMRIYFTAFIESGMSYTDFRRTVLSEQRRLKNAEEARIAQAEWEKAFPTPKLNFKTTERPKNGPFNEGAIRGLYMGQMLKEQHQQNESLKHILRLLGGG